MAFSDDIVANFKYIKEEYRTIEAYKKLSKENFDEYLLYVINYRDIPDEFRNKNICMQMFYSNISKYVREIPEDYRTLELYNFLANTNFCEYYKYIPEAYRKPEMYEKLVALSPSKNITVVPIEKRNSKMYDMLFNECGLTVINDIPQNCWTSNMYLTLIKEKPYEYIMKIPKKLYTLDLAVRIVSINSNLIDYIPSDIKTKTFYDRLLDINFFRYLKIYPKEYYSDELIDLVAEKIKKNSTIIIGNMDINDLIVQKHPYLLTRFNIYYVNQYLKKVLVDAINNKTTILEIKNKYHISESRIIKNLNDIKYEDNDKYSQINAIIFNNKIKDYLSLEKDLLNLVNIINFLGSLNSNHLTLNKKIQIAYLTNRYLVNSLEKIYAYNNSLLANNNNQLINTFIENLLGYNYILDDFDDIKRVKKITFDNEWLNNYNREVFFNIKDGTSRSNYYYGKDKELLTVEQADKITDYLTLNNIPLNYLIVVVAFRKYFNGEIDDYIADLHEFDKIMETNNDKKRIKIKKGV